MRRGKRLRRVSGCIAVVLLIAAATAASASAGEVLLTGKLPGNDAGRKGTVDLDLKTAADGTPRSLVSIRFHGVDYHCVAPSSGPLTLDTFEILLPATKVKKHGSKYSFSTSEGPAHMSATVSKNGSVIRGAAHFEFVQGYDPEAPVEEGTSCQADVTFKATDISKSRTAV